MSKRRVGGSDTNRRDQVLRFLRERDAATEINEIAANLDVHPNTVRFHLETLLSRGQVVRTSGEHGRPGRPPRLFAAVPAMDPAGPRRYQLLADILAAGYETASRPRQHAVEAGRRWGRREAAATPAPATSTADGEKRTDAAIDELVRVLDDLDFAPELTAGGEGDTLPMIGLRHCPFMELVDSRADIVCPLHLGLMRGVLETKKADVTVERLDAFVQPDLCTARLEFTESP